MRPRYYRWVPLLANTSSAADVPDWRRFSQVYLGCLPGETGNVALVSICALAGATTVLVCRFRP